MAEIDPLLEPLLQLTDQEQVDESISHLIAGHAEPVIKAILRYKLHINFQSERQPDANDIYQEVIVRLLERLRQFRQQPDLYPISDLRGMTAMIAYRTSARWRQRQFPERHAFKNRLSYLLTRQRGFALWLSENKKSVAGFAKWQGRKDLATQGRLNRLREDEALLIRIRSLKFGNQADWGGCLAAIFDSLGSPIEFDKLTGFLVEILQIGIQPSEITDQSEVIGRANAVAEQYDSSWQTEKRIFLERLWEEVRRLPRNQRAALLLNLRDQQGRGRLALFPILGIANIDQLAEALEMSVETLIEMWEELPLDDNRIGELMQLTRQQVINARKSARERLTRRLRGFI
ncbi:MAG: hypothetical protein J2P41_09405 [Blastocatellia bacterium]|nr:hypothetical protein [Blastocatellia bacterium]